jgi:histidine triad (HIT) family protein
MNECLFCNIIQKNAPSTIVYEDDNVLAFLDINPVNLGHTLVVPKTHSQNIYETPDEHLQEIIIVVKKLAVIIKKAIGAEGINIINNNDKPAGQLIFHTHFHIIPRFDDDGFKHWQGKVVTIDEIKNIAEIIKKYI